MFLEDREFDLNHDGKLDAFEFGYKLDEEEREIRDTREHPIGNRMRFPTLLIVIVCTLIVLAVNLIVNVGMGIDKSLTYSHAKRLVWRGEYKEAETLFLSVHDTDYRDTRSYILLCWAYKSYDKGDFASALVDLRSIHMNGLTVKQEKQLAVFREQVEEAYKACAPTQMTPYAMQIQIPRQIQWNQ